MKKNSIRILAAMLCLLMVVALGAINFTPAKYSSTFDGTNVGLTVSASAQEPEEPVVMTVLEAGPTFNARIKNAKTITFGKPAEYPQFTWSLTELQGVAVDADGTGGIQLFDDGAGNYYVLCEETIATGTDCSKMFYNCTGLTAINGLEKIDTSSATTMASMFEQCGALTSVNLSKIKTSNVTTMKNMFHQCKGMTSINLSNFDTANVTTMEYMFYGCSGLTSLNLSSFDTGSVTKMTSMFSHCEKIETLDLSNFNTENVTSMASMFYICHALKSVNLSSFDTEKVTTMAHMFYACHSLEKVDISSFSTPALTDIQAMFSDCEVLTTIYASEKWTIANVTNADTVEVFDGSTNIVGGQGTEYSADHVNKAYAVVDDIAGSGVPGYFTLSDYIYKIYYHSFDENGNDYVWKVQGLHADDDVPALSPPKQHSGLTFIGWSSQGQWIDPDTMETPSSIPSNVDPETWTFIEIKPTIFGESEPVKVAELLIDGEVHLYDIYKEYTLTVRGTGLVASDNVWFGIAVADTEAAVKKVLSDDNNERWYVAKYNNNLTYSYQTSEKRYWIMQSIIQKEYVHYVHPGLYVGLEGSRATITNDPNYYYTNLLLDGKTVVDYYWNASTEASTGVKTYVYKFGLDKSVVTVNPRVYKNSSSGGSSGNGTCFAAGTLITMADGSKVPVEEVKQGDMARVYDHYNGGYTEAPIIAAKYDGEAEWLVTNLEFSDGTSQKFIGAHALFNLDLNKYVYITAENYEEFMGHRFAKEKSSGYGAVTLENAWAETEFTGCYALTTEYHLNFFVNGMFSMEGGLPGLFNIFDYDEDLKYDPVKMQRDIETYGLFTYDDFSAYMSETLFERIFPIKYLKVSIGKGLATFEDLEWVIERHIYGLNLEDYYKKETEEEEEIPEEESEEETEGEELEEENPEEKTEEEEKGEASEDTTEGKEESSEENKTETEKETEDKTEDSESGDKESGSEGTVPEEKPEGDNETEGEETSPEEGEEGGTESEPPTEDSGESPPEESPPEETPPEGEESEGDNETTDDGEETSPPDEDITNEPTEDESEAPAEDGNETTDDGEEVPPPDEDITNKPADSGNDTPADGGNDNITGSDSTPDNDITSGGSESVGSDSAPSASEASTPAAETSSASGESSSASSAPASTPVVTESAPSEKE